MKIKLFFLALFVLITSACIESGTERVSNEVIGTSQQTTAEEIEKEISTDTDFNNLSYYDWRVGILYDFIEVGGKCQGLTSLKCDIIINEFTAKYEKRVRWIGTVKNVGGNVLGNLEVIVQLHDDDKRGMMFRPGNKEYEINLEKTVYFNPGDLETALSLDIGDKIELEMMVDTECYMIERCKFDLKVLSFKKI